MRSSAIRLEGEYPSLVTASQLALANNELQQKFTRAFPCGADADDVDEDMYT
jgi:hypothetical protein